MRRGSDGVFSGVLRPAGGVRRVRRGVQAARAGSWWRVPFLSML